MYEGYVKIYESWDPLDRDFYKTFLLEKGFDVIGSGVNPLDSPFGGRTANLLWVRSDELERATKFIEDLKASTMIDPNDP